MPLIDELQVPFCALQIPLRAPMIVDACAEGFPGDAEGLPKQFLLQSV